MCDDLDELMEFKFHWLNDNGQATSVFRKKGSFDGDILILEEEEIPAEVIIDSACRDNRIALTVLTADEEEQFTTLLIQLSSKHEVERLKKSLDVTRSAFWAKQHHKELTEKGLGGTFRSDVCPECHATLILSNMPVTPQLYCHYCDSLSTVDPHEEPIPLEQDLRICEECGMYTRPQKFTIFYFYFLVVVYGFWSNPTWRCPPCMRGEAWKMFFGNLIFVLGVPVAIMQLIRSYGGSSVGGVFKGLDAGNIKARKGDLIGAVENYRTILGNVPVSAGVKYNIGMALLEQGNLEKAADTFEMALKDCTNYVPAYGQLLHLLEQLDETDRLKELKSMWDSVPDDNHLDDGPLDDDIFT